MTNINKTDLLEILTSFSAVSCGNNEIFETGESFCNRVERLHEKNKSPKGLGGFFKKEERASFNDYVQDQSPDTVDFVHENIIRNKSRIMGVLFKSIAIIDDGFINISYINSNYPIENNGLLSPILDFLTLEQTGETRYSFPRERLTSYELARFFRYAVLNVQPGHGEFVDYFKNLITDFHEKKRISVLDARRSKTIDEIEKDQDGAILIESVNGLDELLRKFQADIIKIDRNYVQNFVKTSQFLKIKRDNMIRVYGFLRSTNDISDLNGASDLLKEEKYKYDLILLHSMTMLSSLVDDDMITFYESYELFDKFGIFNSQWQNETSQKLQGIDDSINSVGNMLGSILIDILRQTQKMEASIVGAINNLTYVTSNGFANLDASLSKKLASIDSRLRTGNLVASINAYQIYKISKVIPPQINNS